RVGTEPGGDAARRSDGTQRRELGLAVEPVPRLALPRRRAGAQHPAPVTPDRVGEPALARRTCRAHRREDAAARRVELLVAGASGAERELLDAVAAEGGVRVTVDEPRHGRETATVEL